MTTAQPLVSIIIRTMPGRCGLLREALASVVAQTYRPLEVLVVEDGGSEAAEITSNTSADGIKIQYIPLPSSGRCIAGNRGLEKATGAYIGFLDDDDQFFESHVALLVEALQKNIEAPAAYSYAEKRETVMHDKAEAVYDEKYTVAPFPPPQDFWPHILHNNMMPIQAVLFRKNVYEKYGGLHPSLDHFEDWDLWLRYAQAGMFVRVPEVTSMYRMPHCPKIICDRYKTAAAYLPKLRAASKDYVWPIALGALEDVLKQPVDFWIMRKIKGCPKVFGLLRAIRHYLK